MNRKEINVALINLLDENWTTYEKVLFDFYKKKFGGGMGYSLYYVVHNSLQVKTMILSYYTIHVTLIAHLKR